MRRVEKSLLVMMMLLVCMVFSMPISVDAKNKVEPAVFAVPGKKQGEPERDALVWSCGDTYLVIFSPADSRETPFMERQALAVCYVMKDHCGVTRYPIAVLPEMSAELE